MKIETEHIAISKRGILKPRTMRYRFAFNGKENDNEVKGTGNQQDYGFRIYDPRLGRFLSLDPLTKEFPELTPYQFASNSPIMGIDWDGLEFRDYKSKLPNGTTQIKRVIFLKVLNSTNESDATIKKYAEASKLEIEKAYSGFDAKTKTKVKTEVKLKYVKEANVNEDFYLEFTNKLDPSKNKKSTNPYAAGRTYENGNTENNSFQVLINKDTKSEGIAGIANTATHELGHGGGLPHNDSPGNLMNTSSYIGPPPPSDVTPEQLKIIEKTVDKNQPKK